MKETIIAFMPMTTIYAIASLIALWRRVGEQSRSQGFRRWRRMNLWLLGAIGAAFALAYVQWSAPGPSPSLMYLAGGWLVYCIIAAGIAAALLSFLRARTASKQN
jgi:hypothetical protein